MRLILMGPPGAGKGTQAEKLRKEFALPHISTGDMFRKAIKEETELGKEAKKYLDSGGLVPDEITVGIVKERLQQPDCKAGFMLDGFPRTVPQAEALDKTLAELNVNLDAVIYINVLKEKLVKRLTGRRICKDCAATYHIDFIPSQEEGRCGQCGGELYQRSDDTIETVDTRLNVYLENTRPLIDHYRVKGILKEIDGDQTVAEVFDTIQNCLRRERV